MSRGFPKTIEVVNARYTEGFRLHVFFSDGTSREVDFGLFVKRCRLPDVVKYAKPNAFKRFRVVNGNVMWGDYEMIFPVEQLYQGKISS